LCEVEDRRLRDPVTVAAAISVVRGARSTIFGDALVTAVDDRRLRPASALIRCREIVERLFSGVIQGLPALSYLGIK